MTRTLRRALAVLERPTVAFLLLGLGVLLAFVFAEFRYDQTIDRVEERARQTCEAGNERSRLQVEDLLDSQRQVETFDFSKMFNVSPEQGEEFRRLSRESSRRRLRAVPFLDCKTGDRLPPAEAP